MHLAANEELRERYKSAGSQLVRLSAENAQLREQRDAARREVCESEQYCVDRSREEAERRGWDCYKEPTK